LFDVAVRFDLVWRGIDSKTRKNEGTAKAD
jgi:hypothetical protein